VGAAGVGGAVAGALPQPQGDGRCGGAGGAGADAVVVQEQPGDAEGVADGEDQARLEEAVRPAAEEGGGEGAEGEAAAELPPREEGGQAEGADEAGGDARAGATQQAVCPGGADRRTPARRTETKETTNQQAVRAALISRALGVRPAAHARQPITATGDETDVIVLCYDPCRTRRQGS